MKFSRFLHAAAERLLEWLVRFPPPIEDAALILAVVERAHAVDRRRKAP